MDLSEKIIDKKEELLDEFENLSLEQIAKKIKEIENRDDDVIFKIAYLAARISVLNQRIQAFINENSANDNLIKETISLKTILIATNARKIINNSPIAINYTIEAQNLGENKVLNEGLEVEASYFKKVFESADSKEGLSAFTEKRKPNFTGK